MVSKNGRGSRLTLIPTLSMLIIFSFTFRQTEGHRLSSPASAPTRKNLIETNKVTNLEAYTQSDYTPRVDPLNHFKKYRGGYNITNIHYWASTVYTGVAGYAMGALWLFFGIAFGATLIATKVSFHNEKRANLKQKSRLHDLFYLYSTLSAIFLAILAIVGCGLVLGGNQRFHSEARSVVNIVMETANEASKTIYNTTRAMKDVRNNLEESHANIKASTFLSSTSEKLDVHAADIDRQSKKKTRLIDRGLKILYIIIAVAISSILVAVLALSASGVLKLHRGVIFTFIIICWFLTVLCWILFGMYLFLSNFSSDTCTALDSFQQNPYNSTLSSVLPCNELLSAKSVLTDFGAGIYDLVNTVNKEISESYSNIALVCNPFSDPPFFRYQPDNCTANAIRIADIPEVLKSLTCSGKTSEECQNRTLISNTNIKTVEAYTSSIQDILNVYPNMEDLVECQSVKNAISKILQDHCKPLKAYIHMVWGGMVFLSVIMVFLVLIWASKVHHEEKRHFSDGSVNPTAASTLENGPIKVEIISQ